MVLRVEGNQIFKSEITDKPIALKICLLFNVRGFIGNISRNDVHYLNPMFIDSIC